MVEVQVEPAVATKFEGDAQLADKDALVARLDELLEKYLHTIDEYQKSREQLSKQLSSGYLSLAQANFQNRTGAHYGQDNYDERMQAVRKVAIKVHDVAKAEDKVTLSVVSDQSSATHPKTPDNDGPKDEPVESEDQPESTEKSAKTPKLADPLRWFGILVPPALRSAQSNFIGVVEGAVPHSANIAKDLRSQEVEIGRLRKQIKKL